MSNNVENISKKVGGFLGAATAPVIKATGFCLTMICNSVSNVWGEFSKEVAPEVENIKNKISQKNITECLDEELDVFEEKTL